MDKIEHPIAIQNIRHVEIVNGVRTERDLSTEEIEEWVRTHVSIESLTNTAKTLEALQNDNPNNQP